MEIKITIKGIPKEYEITKEGEKEIEKKIEIEIDENGEAEIK